MKKTVCIIGFMALLATVTAVSAQQAPPATSPDTRVYIIKEGDTLWNISNEVYQDPKLWPIIWELNPQLKDPNTLKPGESLVVGKPAPAETAPAVTTPETATKEAEPAVRMIPEETTTYPQVLPPPVSPATGADEKFTMKPSDVYYIPKVLNAGFISKKELEDSGTIDHTRDKDRLLLTEDNIVFVKFPKKKLVTIKRGDRFTIFRVSEKVEHPVTHKMVGYAVTIVGELEVTSIGSKTAAGIVSNATDVVMIDDRVRPFEPSVKTIRVEKGKNPVVGYIVYTLSSEKYYIKDPMIGENDIVYIDRGYADGVRTGNVFDILRVRDEYDGQTLTAEEYQDMLQRDTSAEEQFDKGTVYPPDVIGQIVVLSAGEYTSTAVVNKSNANINLGDMVRLQVE
jgi:LysM repeat protein